MKTIGHQQNYQIFLDLIKTHKLPQSILFYGINGIGKKRVALDIVFSLFCKERETPLDYCNTCQSCQMIAENNHPDLFVITPTPPKSQQSKNTNVTSLDVSSNWTIKTEQIQTLRQKLIHYPLMAERQFIIIDDAEKMTTATANSLLKILEEPRPQQTFILITNQLHKIIPTIRSRLTKFYFSPLSDQQVIQIIQTLYQEEELPNHQTLTFLARTFQGSVINLQKAINTDFDWSSLPALFSDQNFIHVSKKARDIMATNIDLHLFLQCLKQYCLDNYTNLSQKNSSDSNVFKKIAAAETELSRHIQKEFILENLFM